MWIPSTGACAPFTQSIDPPSTRFSPPLLHTCHTHDSVQFSNHTGYEVCKGEVMQGEQLLTLVSVRACRGRRGWPSHPFTCRVSSSLTISSPFSECQQGLEANGLLKGYTHLLTGYIGSPSFLKAVVEVAHKLKVRERDGGACWQ